MGPVAPHLFSMTWKDGLFVHWPVDSDRLRPHVPDPLELDTRDGQGWVSAVPFVLADAGFRGQPDATRVTVPELNLRTYVRLDGRSGLYFFSIDLGRPALAALFRRLTRLPCYRAEIRAETVRSRTEFVGRRTDPHAPSARFAASYGPDGDVYRAEPGSLDYWLTARRRFYAPRGSGVLYGDIAHERWPLRPADVELRSNTLFEAAGLPEPEGEPVTHYCGELTMTGSILRRLPR